MPMSGSVESRDSRIKVCESTRTSAPDVSNGARKNTRLVEIT